MTGPTGPAGSPGAQGPTGPTGPEGAAGAPATINGVNALTLEAAGGLTGQQDGGTYTIGLPTGGTNGQVLKKTAGGAEWGDAPSGLPDGGTPGQMLWQGESGPEWGDRPVLSVHLTYSGGYHSDKTQSEIAQAAEDGYAVFAQISGAAYSGYVLPYVGEIGGSSVFFTLYGGKKLTFSIQGSTVSPSITNFTAEDVEFLNASSGLSSTNVQDAIDELASKGNGALYVHLENEYYNGQSSNSANKTPEEVYQAYQDGLAVFLVVPSPSEGMSDVVPLSFVETYDGAIHVEFTKTVMFGDTTNSNGGLYQATFLLSNEEPPGHVTVTEHYLTADRIGINSIDGLEAYSVQGALEEINAKIPEQSASSGPKIATVTISGTGWQGGEPPASPSLISPGSPVEKGDPAYQVVTVEGVIADSSAQVIDVVPATREDMDKWNTYGVWCTDQWDGRLVFTCESCPVSAVPTPEPTPGDTPGTPDSPDSESYDIQVNIRMWEVGT